MYSSKFYLNMYTFVTFPLTYHILILSLMDAFMENESLIFKHQSQGLYGNQTTGIIHAKWQVHNQEISRPVVMSRQIPSLFLDEP